MRQYLSPMVAAAKLPVFNPGEFELWKIRINNYFLMTDNALLGRDPKGGKITGKGKISIVKCRISEDVYFVKELKFNLFSVSQMCDKKNSILFTDTECVILSPDFKLVDENHVLLRVSRKDNMYSVDLKNIVPSGGLTCLFAKATLDESNLWHRMLRSPRQGLMERLMKGFSLYDTLPIAKHSGYSTVETRITQTKSMNYEPVVVGNQSNGIADTKACENAGKARMETVRGKDYILLPFLTQDPPFSSSSKDSPDAGFKPSGEEEKKDAEHLENEDSEVPNTEEPRVNQEQDESVNSTNNINTVSSTVNTASIEDNVVDENIVYGCVDDPNMPNLEEIVYSDDDEDVDAEADMTNLDTHILVSPTPTTRIHKDHPLEQIIGDIHSAPQTRRMTKSVTDHVEPKKVIQALTDPSWIEAMQDELLQFKLQKVWTLVDLPYGKRAIGTKWIYRNKKDERDLNEEVYVLSTSRVEDSSFPNIVYKVEKDTIWTTSALRAGKKSLSTEYWIIYCPRGLQVTQKDDGIFISQDKYVDDILKKFSFSTVKTTSTPMETSKPLMKDENAEDVDVHLYRSMIGSLMYLTSSRPDIMFAQTVVANSTTKAEYVAASSCRGQINDWNGWKCKDEISSKSTAWNEFGTNIASAVICLAKNQKFNFSKLIFDGMLRNLDPNSKKFLMYPRFLQLFLNNQIENLTPTFNDEYDTPSHTKKVFANMRRQGKDFLGTVTPLFATMLIQPQADVGEGSGQPTEPQHTPTTASPSNIEPIPIIASSSQPQKTHKRRKTKRPTKISQSSGPTTLVADETVHEERGDSMERAATTAASLDAEQDSGNIIRTQSMATLNEPIPQGTGSGSGPRRQDTILGDRPAQTRFERLSKQSNDPPLSGVNTPGSGEDRLKIMELMEICTKLSDRVLALENVKTAQDLIESSADKSLGDQEDASKQGRNIAESDQDEEISFVQEDAETQGSLEEIRRVTIQREEEANLISWDNTQAMMEADYELAQRLQAEEQGELTIKKRSRLFVELMDNRKKHFAKLRAEEVRRKPPTKAQKKNQMSTYLRNMAGYKHTQLKNKSFKEIQMLFDKEIKRVNSFVPIDSEVVEGSGKKTKSSRKETVSKKRAGEEHDEENVKRQKLEDDVEKAELQLCLEIVLRDNEDVNVESLSIKYPIAGKGKIEIASPEGYDGLLWGDLITLFEPSEDDEIWKAQQNYTLISWRLFDSCGIHLLLTDTGITIHMLVERKYPLTQEMLSRMLSRRLEVDNACEMALLNFSDFQDHS
ncbi:hypothetical protein Tco_0449420 [Tanacetum coccineum]